MKESIEKTIRLSKFACFDHLQRMHTSIQFVPICRCRCRCRPRHRYKLIESLSLECIFSAAAVENGFLHILAAAIDNNLHRLQRNMEILEEPKHCNESVA